MKKRLHILFMALLAMAVLGGCGADGTGESSEDTSSKEQNVQETEISEGPVYGGSVVVGIQQDIDSLDPHKATAAGTKEILFNVFEGLVKPDENGKLNPEIISVIQRNFDEIVGEAAENCAPALENYYGIQLEYRRLLVRYLV